MKVSDNAPRLGAYTLAAPMAPGTLVTAIARALESRWAPVVAGLIASALMTYVWGGLTQVPAIHDEVAYLLQAKIFASGHLVAAARPLPHFFEQYHVFTTPIFAAKYPPGHSLLLAPGVFLGLPGLMPVIVAGVSAALLFVIARRLTNVWVALVAWLLWTTAPGTLAYETTYLSQSTTIALWLASAWALLEWRASGRRRWLVALAALVGFGSLVRPLTMLVFALPAAVVAMRTIVRRRAWRDLTAAAAVSLAFVAATPLWSWTLTGSIATSPHGLYARLYMPFDRMGFGLERTPAVKDLPADMRVFNAAYEPMHAAYTLAAVPEALALRAAGAAHDMFAGWRMVLAPLAVVALFALSAELWFGIVAVVLLLLAHLVYAHSPGWSVYYLEAQPLLALLTALGVWRLLTWVAARVRGDAGASTGGNGMVPRALPVAMLLAAAVVAVGSRAQVLAAKTMLERRTAYHRSVRTAIAQIREPAIVFVRYAAQHNRHVSVIDNEPDLTRARVWIVYDRGIEENMRLMAVAPERAAYLYDEDSGSLSRVAAPLGGATRDEGN